MVEHSAFWDTQAVHTRLILDKIPDSVSVEWPNTIAVDTEASSAPALDSTTASFFRIVVEAPSAGIYSIELSTFSATWQMPLMVYVNGGTGKAASLNSTTWWQEGKLEYSSINVSLSEGRNVIIIQYYKYGNIVTYSLPEALSLVDFGSDEPGIYNQADFVFGECRQIEGTDLFDANAPITYGDLRYNTGNWEWKGTAGLRFTPLDTTRSLDVDVSVTGSGLEGTLGVKLNDGDIFNVTFPIDEDTVHIPSYTLEEHGWKAGEENEIFFLNPVSGQTLSILGMSESIVSDAKPGEGKVYEGAELKSSILVKGRSLEIEEGIALDWSGSGIAFDITGGGDVRASFNALSNTMNTRFAVEIDGEFTGYAAPTENALLATGLSEETHRIELTKTSEANGGLTNLLSITVGEGATIAPASEKETKMLFLGGSIVCGNQMDENGDEDQYQAFANLLAKAWDADYQVVAASGRGLIQGTLGESGWAADNTKQISHIWTKTSYFRDSEAEYAVDSYVPDAIVLNVGNNDIGQCEKFGNTEGDVAAECAKFIEETLLVKYPNAKVIFAWGIGTTHSDTATAAFQSAIEGIESPNVSFVNFDPQIQGQGGHPSYYQHDYIASVISETLAEMTSEEDPYVRKYYWQSQEFEDATIKNSPNAKLHVYPETKGQNWSGNAYYGDLSNFSGTIDEILPDGSNVGHAEFTFTVDRDGLYNLQLGYATSATVDIAYNADGGDFLLAEGLGTNDWCGGHGHYANLPIVLTAGTHVIRVTAPIGDGWANYDYLNLLYVAESEVVAEADAWAESFMSTTGPLCEDVTLGSIASFPEDTWTELADSYALLSDEAKNLLVGAPDYEDMRARYGQIQPKYGYEDFLKTPLGHEVEKAAFYAPMDANPFVEDMLWWILPAALVALALLGGSAYYAKKRRAR